jgi:hypothetical protein
MTAPSICRRFKTQAQNGMKKASKLHSQLVSAESRDFSFDNVGQRWIHQAMRADLERAQQLAGEMRQLGDIQDDTVARVMGCWSSGFTCLHLGDFAAAQAHLERGLVLFDPIQRPHYSELTPIDALVFLLTQLSLVLACYGYLDHCFSPGSWGRHSLPSRSAC